MIYDGTWVRRTPLHVDSLSCVVSVWVLAQCLVVQLVMNKELDSISSATVKRATQYASEEKLSEVHSSFCENSEQNTSVVWRN